MTDAEPRPDAESARPEDVTPTESGTESARTAEQEQKDPRSASFRSDGGPGSVLRERQPGFGGMDAREAAEGEPHWQDVTSDRYGHRTEPAPKAEETDDTSGEPPSR